MRPAFSNALYYPSIDILDTDWLKTAILFWDTISTIVPESLKQPYRNPDTQYLKYIGFLRPLYVNPDDKSVVSIEDDILNLLSSQEIAKILSSPRCRYSPIWNDKISFRIQNYLKEFWSGDVCGDTLSDTVQKELRGLGCHLNNKNIYYLKDMFVYIYMTMLANKLCEDYSLGMITDDDPCFNIGNVARYGDPKGPQLEQGILLDFIIKGFAISPDTSFADILAFKEHHKDELGRFRTQLTKLTQNIDMNKPIDVVQKEIEDLYINEFLPAYNDCKAALKGFHIKQIVKTVINTAFLSVSSTGIPMKALEMSVEHSLLASAGILVTAQAVLYNTEKKQILRENPYSYLMSINHEWRRK